MPTAPKVLVVDDEESMRAGCTQALAEDGFSVQTATDGKTGLALAQKDIFDLIILDLKMPGIDGMEVLEELKAHDPDAVVVVITGYATVESAVEAMKRGAYDFLPKPFTPEALVAIARRAVDRRRLTVENAYLRRELDGKVVSGSIVASSEAMQTVLHQLRKVAPTDTSVLVCGETGVGKELIAREINRQSSRSDKPFVTVDCGALVETLFESELFGHVKGAFTGAVQTTYGKFELANGGTLFLDEIGNVGPSIQVKLLRVLQERKVVKVGSANEVEVDVRVIAATNLDLEREVREGRFREDLFYRLNVFPINVPPLRDRSEDIPLLAKHFLAKCGERRRKRLTGFSPEAMEVLLAHNWPGNVRELENAVERATVLSDGDVIEPSDLPGYAAAQNTTTEPTEGGQLAKMERLEIVKALGRFSGQRGKAAEFLGINRKTLREKIRRHNIDAGI